MKRPGGAVLYYLGRNGRGQDTSGRDLLLGALLPAFFRLAQAAADCVVERRAAARPR